MSGIHKNIGFVKENGDINDILCAQSKLSAPEYLLMPVSSFFWPLNCKRFTWHMVIWDGGEMLFLQVIVTGERR